MLKKAVQVAFVLAVVVIIGVPIIAAIMYIVSQ
jgi:hypothetical protein